MSRSSPHPRLLVALTILVLLLAGLSRPLSGAALAQEDPETPVSEELLPPVEGDPGDTFAMEVIQQVAGEDEFARISDLVAEANNPSACAAALAQLIRGETMPDSVGADCGTGLAEALDILQPYIDCPPGAECLDRDSVVLNAEEELDADGTTRAAPAPPTGLRVSEQTPTSFKLSWTRVGNPQRVTIYFRPVGTSLYESRERPGSETYYTLEKLRSNTTYQIFMTAANGSESSGQSQQIQGTTTGGTPPPAVPADVRVMTRGQTSLTITWTTANPETKNFTVRYNNGGTAEPSINVTTGVGRVSWTHVNLQSNTEYRYQVQACLTTGVCSDFSSVLVARTEAAPPQPVPVALTIRPSACANVTGTHAAPYVRGEVIALRVTPCAGGKFINWTGDQCNTSTQLTCTFTLNNTTTINVNVQPPLPANKNTFRVAAIGDSIGSGEGAPDKKISWLNTFPLKTEVPAGWYGAGDRTDLLTRENDRCHRSAGAPASVAADLARQRLKQTNPALGVQFISYACSGATIKEGLLGNQSPLDRSTDKSLPPIPSQVGRLASLMMQPAYRASDGSPGVIDALVITIGANDLEFSEILKNCAGRVGCQNPNSQCISVFEHAVRNKMCNPNKQPTQQFEENLKRITGPDPGNSTMTEGTNRYYALKRAIDESLRVRNIYVVGYYDPLHDQSGNLCDQQSGWVLDGLEKAETEWAATTVLPRLIDAARGGASILGATFVEPVTEFRTHGYCATPESARWINTWDDAKRDQGPTSTNFLVDTADFIPVGTVHPNRVGHNEIGKKVFSVLKLDSGDPGGTQPPPPPPPPPSGSWVQMTGCANDIGLGANGAIWIVGCESEFGGFAIRRWNNTSFEKVDGGGLRIAVDRDGLPWIVNNVDQIYQRTASGWVFRSGCAKDIGIGRDNSVFIIGCASDFGGTKIQRWNGNSFVDYGGAGVRIAVGDDGLPWIVNNQQNGQVYQRLSGDWTQRPGCGKDIGAGGGATWIVGCEAGTNGNKVQRWTGNGWETVDGVGGTAISVGPDGKPYVVNSNGSIYRRQ